MKLGPFSNKKMLDYLRSAFPPAETQREKQNNFQFLLRKIWRAGVKKLKENCFALMSGLTPNGGNISRPTAPTAQNGRATPPTPFLFARPSVQYLPRFAR